MAVQTFAEQINKLAARMGTECKTLKGSLGDLNALTTDEKTSLVLALNEVKGKITGAEGSVSGVTQEIANIKKELAKKVEIDDSQASGTKTYSSTKVDSQITAARDAVKNEILGGAGAAYDTLQELATLIQGNKDLITGLQEISGKHVRFDQAQELTLEQKKFARDNIGAAEAEALNTLNGTVTEQGKKIQAVEASAGKAGADIGTVGDLVTSAKTVVPAINEVKGQADKGVADAAKAQTKADEGVTKATKAQGDVDALKASLGDLNIDFVAAFEAALGTPAA